MKIAITVAMIALLASACATDPAREAAREARVGTCFNGSWLYTQGKYVCTAGNDLSQRSREAENIRNTPYENARSMERLARSTPEGSRR